MKKIMVPLAEGFEEIEAITIIDVLRRASMEVVTATLDSEIVSGAHGIKVLSDRSLENVQKDFFDAIVLPGGMPGTKNLLDSPLIKEILKRYNSENKIIGAICAAPWVLNDCGILDGKCATIYPGMEERIKRSTYLDKKVVIDGSIITSKGPGTAGLFAIALVSLLLTPKESDTISKQLLLQP